MNKIRRELAGVAILAALVFVPAILAGQAQDGSAPRTAGAGFPDLVGALKATPGVFGVETARTQSGKQVIFAWFENKKAALTWYIQRHASIAAEGLCSGLAGPNPDGRRT